MCKEVILSAGTFNTPQLLMLSRIGDQTELMNLGIRTRVNLPSVGENITDHITLPIAWRVNNDETTQSFYNPRVLPQEIQEWNHKGPLSWTVLSQMASLRLPPNDTIIQRYGDPSPGPTSACYQLIWGNGWASSLPRPQGNWMTIQANLVSQPPVSVSLSSPCYSASHRFSDRRRGQTEHFGSIQRSHHRPQCAVQRL